MGNERLFTKAWIEGVMLAGEHLFEPGNVETATDYRELRPNREAIEKILGAISPGEYQFILAMYSFFNDAVAGEMAERSWYSKSVNGLVYTLDEVRRSIIARLLVYYPGW